MLEAEARRTKISIGVYLVLTFAFSSVFYRLIIHQGTLAAHGGLLVAGLMWSPGAAGLLTRLFFQGNLRGHGWGWGKWKYEFAGYWIPLAYAAVVYVPLWLAGAADFHSPVLSRAGQLIAQHGLASWVAVPAYFLTLATLGMLSSCSRALGEELGWRGFLVPQLAKITSFRGVAFTSGIIWSLWHYPLILFANYNGAGPRWYSLACFTVMVIGISFLFAWMRLKSGSVWPCMLLHASHNVFIQAFFNPLTRPGPLTNYMIGEFGAGLAILAILLAVIFDRKRGELPGAGEI
ncbi:MAG TPA: CPBP family intramembrane glutamic endopeptidase [Candidatus Acidoferrales bacterium]|nr:CPBP family intramembrane glutamic endopeptidase [Candidatus Acidoferrales bacterium]